MTNNTNKGLANADENTRQRVAHEGGEARKAQGTDYSELGQKGGTAAQQSGNAHELTDEERSQGGQNSSRSNTEDQS